MIYRFIYFPLIHGAQYCFPKNTPRRSTVTFIDEGNSHVSNMFFCWHIHAHFHLFTHMATMHYPLKSKKVWRKIFFASLLNIWFRQKNITELRVEDDKTKVQLHDHNIQPSKGSFQREVVIAIGEKHKILQQTTIRQDFASFIFRKNAFVDAVPQPEIRFLAISRAARNIFP